MAKKSSNKENSAENVDNIESIDTNVDNIESDSTLSSGEFMDRLMSATQKHVPVNPQFNSEEESEIAKVQFIRKMGRRISHLCPENTMEVVKLVELMYKGEYQNDKMLVLIEEMPEGGYGHE